MNITKWTTQIRLFSLQLKIGTALYSQEKQDLELTGSDQELLFPKFRLKLKKVGKNTRPFRYDPNQILYDYTVDVTNRFKGLDLIDECLKNYGWRFVTLYRRQGARPSPKKRNAKKAKWLYGEALQIAVKEEKQKAKEKRKDKSI